VAFFAAVNRDITAGLTTIPAVAAATKAPGVTCPTTRNFNLIDHDQSDNVTTQYLLNGNGQTAQDTAANTATLDGATVINNGSDNALLNGFLDPTLGCTPFTAPDLTNAGTPGTSQALDELLAAKNQTAPIALVPEHDPMTLVNGGVQPAEDQPYHQRGPAGDDAGADRGHPGRLRENMVNGRACSCRTRAAGHRHPPVPAVGTTCHLPGQPAEHVFTNLNRQNWADEPGDGHSDGTWATAAIINATQQAVTARPARPEPRTRWRLPSPRRGRTQPTCDAGRPCGDHNLPVPYSK
jgi:hypothetical protein